MEFGLLLIRLVVGLTLAAHGAQKLFGMFGGYGIAGTGGFFESLGYRPGKVLATMAGVGETGGGWRSRSACSRHSRPQPSSRR